MKTKDPNKPKLINMVTFSNTLLIQFNKDIYKQMLKGTRVAQGMQIHWSIIF